MKRKFHKFLRKHGAYHKYYTNLRAIEGRVVPTRPSRYIVSAFTWRETKEGAEFWDVLDDLWVKEYPHAK